MDYRGHVNRIQINRLGPTGLRHFLLAKIRRQAQAYTPPVQDGLLNGDRPFTRNGDNGHGLPALLAVLTESVAVHVADADLDCA